MTQSQENEFGDKNNLETGPIWPNLDPIIFFGCSNHQFLLDIIAVYHNIQNQRNVMIQSRENARKPQIWVILGPFCPILGPEFSFSKIGLRHFSRYIEG